jgi:hypothetical protein
MKPQGKKITTFRKEEGEWRGEERERPIKGKGFHGNQTLNFKIKEKT